MNAATKSWLIGGAVLSVVLISTMMTVGVYNYGNSSEQRLEAKWKDNKIVLTNYHKKIAEAVQVPAMARDDLVKVVTAAIQGRYGEGGSKAVFQMITEQNPTTDPSLYSKIQQIIESGRDRFENNQKEMVDIERSYRTALGSVPKGVILTMLGYPKVDLDKYKIIVDDSTEEAFASGKEESLMLRQEK